MATRKNMASAKSVGEETVNKGTPVEKPKPVEKKTYKDSDMIPCLSITAGQLVMQGLKSNILYTWLDAGDVVNVQYDDLIAAIRTRSMYVYRPRFVVKDEEIIKMYPDLDTLYASIYSKDDLKQILGLPGDQMKAVISKMPDGAKEAIKSLAMGEINSGRLDSINAIRTIDEIFGTNMLSKMTT